ncbi:MAG: hypothetical protein EPO08_18710 [Rhodospirillaceae bacterium]|nr:MAG: hypothetical protein EPO08_18710 [Rhodospirillaceae bacterium]
MDPSQLVKAWKAATLGAETGMVLQHGDIEGVEFRWDGGESRFMFADLDASCWAAALDRLYGLDTITGIATLFRLLALIELIARAEWLRPLFRLGHKDGVVLDPDVLHLAAAQKLTPSARFDAADFRRALGDRVAPIATGARTEAEDSKANAPPRRLGRP